MVRQALALAKKKSSKLYCSFCRKDSKSVAMLVGGPGVCICDGCVALCNRVLAGKPTGWEGWMWGSLTDEQLLAALPASEAAVEGAADVLHMQVEMLRSRGVSWAAIGDALGITRQAAWERFS
jgi:ClpX C4-type zinc finger